MSELALAPSPNVVKAIIENHLHLYALPLECTIADIGYTHNQMLELQRKLYTQFRINVQVKHTDTINSISEKLNQKK